MAKMCPIDGCQSTKGMCIHDKIMIAMAVLIMLAAIAHFGLHLF